MLYWDQVNDEFADNWQIRKNVRKTRCNILKSVSPKGKLSQFHNKTTLL